MVKSNIESLTYVEKLKRKKKERKRKEENREGKRKETCQANRNEMI